MPDKTLLQCRNWSFGYDAPNVLQHIDWQLTAGDSVAIVGQNGVGKSSFLKSLMGLMPQVSGEYQLFNRSVLGKRTEQIAALGVAYVPQENAVFNQLSITEHFALIDKQPVEAHLGFFPQLLPHSKKSAAQLSGGQRQQLAIAFALARKPQLLLLDEPSANVQPSIVETITETLCQIQAEQKMTIVLAEQNLSMIANLSTRAYLIESANFINRAIEINPSNPKQLETDLLLLSQQVASQADKKEGVK